MQMLNIGWLKHCTSCYSTSHVVVQHAALVDARAWLREGQGQDIDEPRRVSWLVYGMAQCCECTWPTKVLTWISCTI
jgi:hypothetical protein